MFSFIKRGKEGGIDFTSKVKPMSHKTQEKKRISIEKAIDFGKQLFAAVLRSRKGALTELSRLLRFQKGTKCFERHYNRLLPLIQELKKAFNTLVLQFLPQKGPRLGIIDDSSVKKTGKQFPKEQKHHDHTTNSFYEGMKVLSSMLYQNGKIATISSKIVGKEDNKLIVAQEDIDVMITNFLVDIFLFDSWYCKGPVLEHIEKKKKLFISRTRCDTIALIDGEEFRLDEIIKAFEHKEFKKIKIHGNSYWIKELILELKAYGRLKVICSKEGQFDEPIFLVTNAEEFSAKYVVILYLKRFSIEIFFKDAKQFLNFETFMCRKDSKWDLHLHLTNVLHWAIQKKNSISRTVRAVREDISKCLLFINKNIGIQKLFDELRRLCQT